MALSKPKKVYCVGCGRDAYESQLIELGSLSPLLKACFKCLEKYGKKRLEFEADRLLALFAALPKPRHPFDRRGKCFHCGANVIVNPVSGEQPLWCDECNRELQRIRASSRPTEVAS